MKRLIKNTVNKTPTYQLLTSWMSVFLPSVDVFLLCVPYFLCKIMHFSCVYFLLRGLLSLSVL